MEKETFPTPSTQISDPEILRPRKMSFRSPIMLGVILPFLQVILDPVMEITVTGRRRENHFIRVAPE